MDYLKAVENRRSVYAIGNQENISKSRVQELVSHALAHAPTSYNSQSSRVVLLFGDHHKALWDIVLEALRPIAKPGRFPATEKKIAAFAAGWGTVLYFDDNAIVQGLQEKLPSYKDVFPLWSMQAAGMLQYIVWTALESEGLGASLQHYNPLIDEAVRIRWNLPEHWQLLAQMPFGNVVTPPDAKPSADLSARLIVHE